jgi:hypothetical protein
MYRPADSRAFEQTNQDRVLREALIGVFEALLPGVSEASYLKAVPEIEAASNRISDALHKRIEARKT